MTTMRSTSTSTQDMDHPEQGSPRRVTTSCTGTDPLISPKVTMCSRFVSTWDDFGPPTSPPNSTSCSSTKIVQTIEDNDDEEIEATDNLLGRLRRGMNIIETHARETMSECDSEETRLDMEERLEKSTLTMLKAEKSFMNTARIIAEVVDEYSCEYEHVSGESGGNGDDDDKQVGNDEDKANDDDKVESCSGDDDERVMFRNDILNSASIASFRERMNKIFDERMTTYQNGLTDDILRDDKKFKNLQRQIRYGRKDAERNCATAIDSFPGGEGDVPPSAPHYEEEEEERRTAESEEDDDYDDAILPTLDPISKEPIHTAVTNKLCHHVFDLATIMRFIRDNPDAKCPIDGCRNQAVLKSSDLILQRKLTEQIRVKNDKLYGPAYLIEQ